MKRWNAPLVGIALLCLGERAHAEDVVFGAHDVTVPFTISKSENKNEVAFGARLTPECAPSGSAPIFPFWRMKEKGAQVLEPLLGIEEPAYGIADERVLERWKDGGRVDVTLRAFPSRPITVEIRSVDGRCEAWSVIEIGGEEAYLYNVFAKLHPFGVEYLLLSGWSLDRSHVLHEKIHR